MEHLDKATAAANWFEAFIQHASVMSILLALVGSWCATAAFKMPIRALIAPAWQGWTIRMFDVVVALAICAATWPNDWRLRLGVRHRLRKPGESPSRYFLLAALRARADRRRRRGDREPGHWCLARHDRAQLDVDAERDGLRDLGRRECHRPRRQRHAHRERHHREDRLHRHLYLGGRNGLEGRELHDAGDEHRRHAAHGSRELQGAVGRIRIHAHEQQVRACAGVELYGDGPRQWNLVLRLARGQRRRHRVGQFEASCHRPSPWHR
jgi:hypothetical protein